MCLKDLLCVVAHGTPDAKGPAANLLFYYWPNLNPTHYDRRTVLSKFNSSPTWTPPSCQNPECTSNSGSPGEAVKVNFTYFGVECRYYVVFPTPN